MKIIKKLIEFLKYPPRILLFLDKRRIITLDDKAFEKYMYKSIFGKNLNLSNPQTFNEKLQWLKLYDRNPQYTKMVDKYEVKKYVADIIGEEYIIPTIGIYDKFEDIDFDKLPNQFVMKCTHDSGSSIICKDKSNFDINNTKEKINNALKVNYYYSNREWPYKNVQPRIIIEEYMEDNKDKELRDYKFYCFDGNVHSLLLATDRQSEDKELCFDYFDKDFNHLNFKNYWHPNAKVLPHKPEKFKEMKELASLLSKGFPHVRVDFYEVNGQIYFGEFTFYDMGGCLIIKPDNWEIEWGNLIKLPNQKENQIEN